MKQIKSTSKMLKMFDENADLFSIFSGIKKDFSLIINTLELFVKQMKLTREISQQVKKESENFNEDEFVKEVSKRFGSIIEPIQNDLNKINSKEEDVEYTHPSNPEGRKTTDIKAGVFGFKKGQKFAYLFDFGDEHRFEIEVADFGIVQKGKKYPIFLESKGKSLEQYPDWSDG